MSTIETGDVRGGYELAMQADRLRHEDAVERLRSTARHGRGDWTIPEPLLRKYLAERPQVG